MLLQIKLYIWYSSFAMKKQLGIILIVLITSFFFAFCQKRPFAKIEAHGRIMDSLTMAPLSNAEVSLWVGVSPGSKGSSSYAHDRSNSNGTFSLKSKAQWNGNEYKIQVIYSTSSRVSSRLIHCTITKRQTLDVGEIWLK